MKSVSLLRFGSRFIICLLKLTMFTDKFQAQRTNFLLNVG